MKFFGRKPSSSSAWATPPHAANTPDFRTPVPTLGARCSDHPSTAAELMVSILGMKSGGDARARYDVALLSRPTPLDVEWNLSPEQARELAARLQSAAAECDKANHTVRSLDQG